jgi:hypothetical protein
MISTLGYWVVAVCVGLAGSWVPSNWVGHILFDGFHQHGSTASVSLPNATKYHHVWHVVLTGRRLYILLATCVRMYLSFTRSSRSFGLLGPCQTFSVFVLYHSATLTHDMQGKPQTWLTKWRHLTIGVSTHASIYIWPKPVQFGHIFALTCWFHLIMKYSTWFAIVILLSDWWIVSYDLSSGINHIHLKHSANQTHHIRCQIEEGWCDVYVTGDV